MGETTSEFRIAQWQRYEGEDWWKWAVWLEGDPQALDGVEYVEWRLHPTFPNPVRRKSDRSDNFRLETGGWGTFRIVAKVKKLNDGEVTLHHDLELHYDDGARAPA